jgi:DHA1 family tetracycline resistance protein-like MFS transporter
MPILFGVVLLDLIGFGIVIPILPFLSPQLGASTMDIALIIVSYAACSGLCGPFWGRLSDRIGRKPVIMICLVGSAVAYVLLANSSELWMVYCARAFAGLVAGNIGVASAMMADLTTSENRARGMGLIGAAFGMGLVLGPVMGGLLSGDSGSFMLPCLVAGLMSILAMLAAAVFLPESLSAERRAAHRDQHLNQPRVSTYQTLRQSGNRLLVFQYLLHTSCVSGFTYLFPLWVADLLHWGAREVGIVFGIQGAIMALVQGLLMGTLIRALGELVLLRLSIACFLVGVLTAAFSETMVFMVGSMFVAMTGATLCMPVLNTITSIRTSPALQGRMLGTTSSAAAWGRVVGPLMAGSVLALAGYTAVWLVSAVLLVYYFVWALREPPLVRIGQVQ